MARCSSPRAVGDGKGGSWLTCRCCIPVGLPKDSSGGRGEWCKEGLGGLGFKCCLPQSLCKSAFLGLGVSIWKSCSPDLVIGRMKRACLKDTLLSIRGLAFTSSVTSSPWQLTSSAI